MMAIKGFIKYPIIRSIKKIIAIGNVTAVSTDNLYFEVNSVTFGMIR